MIIKYNDNLILRDWKCYDYGYRRDTKIEKIVETVVNINYYNYFKDQVVIVQEYNSIKNKYYINFYNDFDFMNTLFTFKDRLVEGDIEDIKQQVDNFVIRMSKIRVLQ